MLSKEQIGIIKYTWLRVVPIADVAAMLFYDNLLRSHPELKPMFARSDMAEQRKKLVASLNLVVLSLDSLESVLPALRSLGRKHVGYGVQEEHYDAVGTALLETLGQGLGTEFTPEARAAWTTAYGMIASVMKEAAAVGVAA